MPLPCRPLVTIRRHAARIAATLVLGVAAAVVLFGWADDEPAESGGLAVLERPAGEADLLPADAQGLAPATLSTADSRLAASSGPHSVFIAPASNGQLCLVLETEGASGEPIVAMSCGTREQITSPTPPGLRFQDRETGPTIVAGVVPDGYERALTPRRSTPVEENAFILVVPAGEEVGPVTIEGSRGSVRLFGS